ncbi:MAG: hypothetical protein JRN24_01435, partial [Nitrososphaerota archaeon]|nr:hypothetical protein [Nitrososphaerota archaeon]
MEIPRARAVGAAKAVVIVAIVGAAAFGLYLGYLAYTNDSFPAQQKPFGDYANVVATEFNGTELYYKIQWTAGGEFTPMFAQVTSSSTDAANTPVCGLNLTSVSNGQTIDLPFAIVGATSTSLSNVDLAIAVRANANTTEFTIVYHSDSIQGAKGDI